MTETSTKAIESTTSYATDNITFKLETTSIGLIPNLDVGSHVEADPKFQNIDESSSFQTQTSKQSIKHESK